MFIGHFALGFAAKRLAPTVSLGWLFLAAQFLDLLWPVLLLAGVEVVRVAPGDTAVTPLEFVSYPWSHSLVMALFWSAGLAAARLLGSAFLQTGRAFRGALLTGAVVFSHWVLDFITHRPDLPFSPGVYASREDRPAFGLGLWDSLPGTLAAELSLLAAGLWLYLKATRAGGRAGSLGLWGLVALLLVIYAANLFGPPPPGERAVAYGALGLWLFVLWGFWVDRRRAPRAQVAG